MSRLNLAYGFTVLGLEETPRLALSGTPPTRTITISQVRSEYPDAERYIREDRAVLATYYGAIVVEREAARVEIHATEAFSEAEFVHPYLWPGAALMSVWAGQETFHAGAFLDDQGGAWGVLGNSGQGKSTLLASLALAGREIVADDLLVVEDGQVFGGPRSVDLTPLSAHGLGIAKQTQTVRWTHRRRFPLPPGRVSVGLRGFVYPHWGDELSVEAIPARERIKLLGDQRRITGLGVEALDMLELSSLPALRLTRPQDWELTGAVCELLIDAVNQR